MNNKPNKGSFKPGHKGYNSGGRKKLSPELREARSMAYEKLISEVINVRQLTVTEAEEAAKDPELTLGKRGIIQAYVGTKKDGPNYQAIKYFEDRAFGKAVETIDLGSGDTPEATDNGIRGVFEKFGLIDSEDKPVE